MYKKKIKLFSIDFKQRQTTERQQQQKILLKIFCCLKKHSISNNYFKYLEKNVFRYGTLTRTKNFCVVTSNTQTVYRNFKMARQAIHAKGSRGYLVGVSKASW